MEALLIFKSAISNKFWKIAVAENSYIVTYGRIGSTGSVKTKDFPSAEACLKEAHRLIGSKLKKGYKPAEQFEQVVYESTMTEDFFWLLLEKCKEHGEDSDEQMEWLTTHLSKKPIIDIIAFDAILNKHYAASYTSDLWAAAYIMMGGCSDDCFDYFRAWLLYLGKDDYYAAIEDPETLLPLLKTLEHQEEMPQLEEFLSVAAEAYEEKTGQDFDEYLKLYDQLIQEDYHRDIDLDWDEEDEEGLQEMFPKLWEAYGENPM